MLSNPSSVYPIDLSLSSKILHGFLHQHGPDRTHLHEVEVDCPFLVPDAVLIPFLLFAIDSPLLITTP